MKAMRLLCFAFCFLLIATSCKSEENTKNTPVESTGAEQGTKVVAYYFYGNYRCATCTKLEEYSGDAVHEGFPDEIKKGLVEFKAVNTDEKENEHFVTDYKLYTKSLVIVKQTDGKQVDWKNLEKIWEYVRKDKSDYLKYVQDEIKTYLAEK